MKFKFKCSYLLMVIVVTLVSCSTKQNILSESGAVKITEAFYYGKTEVSNKEWKTYVEWIVEHYGKNSEDYINVLPDTLVWKSVLALNEPYVDYYFRHPAYNNYPVVGISWEQAVNYCKWKTEKVKGQIAAEISKRETLPASVTFRLPTSKEWEQAASANYSPRFKRYIERKELEYSDLYNLRVEKTLASNADTTYSPVTNITAPVLSYAPNEFGLYNLIGNVAEMTAEKGIAKGGGWINTHDENIIQETFSYEKPKAWLGFRCVCDVRWE